MSTGARSALRRSPADAVDLGLRAAAEAERFTEALNAHRMGARLAAALGWGRRPCHVLDAKYEPGVGGVVLYECGDDLVRGDLLLDEATTGPGHPVVQPGVRLSVFPQEPSLPTLPRVMAPAEIGQVLAGALPDQGQLQARALARRCRVELLRYRPGRRATVRVGTVLAGPTYVGKVYHDPDKAAAAAEEARGLAQSLAENGTLRYAPTLAHLPELSLVVQQSVQGKTLDTLLSRPGAAAADGVRLAATALAQMHRSPVLTARQRPVSKELNRFLARADAIATVDAQAGRALKELALRLLQTWDEVSPGPVGMVHGDCKPAQFLVGKDIVYLLDLDHCGVSDQAGDVGAFLASLRQLGVRRHTARARRTSAVDLVELAAIFRTTYLRHVDDDGLSTRTLWHEAAALERKALRAFARAPRSPLAAGLVTEGHRCLHQLRSVAL